jgi:hypothetical protein
MNNARPPLKFLFLAILSFCFLSGNVDRPSFRKLACVDGTDALLANAYFPIENDLFGKIHDAAEEAALKKNALQFYNFLNQVELNYYAGVQSAHEAYGVKSPLFGFFSPQPAPANFLPAFPAGSFNFAPQSFSAAYNGFRPNFLPSPTGLSAAAQIVRPF